MAEQMDLGPCKVERVDEPPYLSDDLVEQIAVLHNGGKWPDHYTEEHRQHWRGQAIKIIELVKIYLAHPLYKISAPPQTAESKALMSLVGAMDDVSFVAFEKNTRQLWDDGLDEMRNSKT
jgi:hypothetical protein